MLLNLEQNTSPYTVRGYHDGEIRINTEAFRGSVLLTAKQLIAPWQIDCIEKMTLADINALLAFKPQLILIGSGEKTQYPDLTLIAHCQQQRVGIEVMDTKAACRTYNVLAGEGRQFLGLLFS